MSGELKTKIPLSLRDEVDRILGRYVVLDQIADDLTERYISETKHKYPKEVPVEIVRQAFEADAQGYSPRLALERVRCLLD
jgi:hypothetical protein